MIDDPFSDALVVFTNFQDRDSKIELRLDQLQKSQTWTLRNSMSINFFAPSVTSLNLESNFEAEFTFIISIKIKSKIFKCDIQNQCVIKFRDIFTPKNDIIANPVLISGMKLIQRVFLRRDSYRHNSYLRKIMIDNQLLNYNPVQLRELGDQKFYAGVVFTTQLKNFESVISTGQQSSLIFRTYLGDSLVYDTQRTNLKSGDSFFVRVLPTIDSVDHHSGSKQGGHLLTITGKSWIKDKTKFIFQNGKECKIQTFERVQFRKSDYKATCITQSNTVSTSPTSAFGGHGFLHQIFLGQTSLSVVQANLATKTPNFKTLMFNAEVPIFDQRTRQKFHVTRSRAFFKAPNSGNYNFLATSKLRVEIKMHTTAPNVIPAAFTGGDLSFEVSYAQFRDPFIYYDGADFTTKSSTVTLVQDNYYYMEIWTEATSGEDAHTSFGFITDSGTNIQGNNLTQVQRLSYVSQPLVFDEYEFIVQGLSNKFSISYTNNWGSQAIISDIESSKDTAAFHNKIAGYFGNFNEYWDDIIVTKDFLDTSKVPTIVAADMIYVRFTVHMKKVRDTPRQAVGTPQFTLRYHTQGDTCTTVGHNCQIRFSAGQPGQSGTWTFIVTDPTTNQAKTSKALDFSKSLWEFQSQLWTLVPQFSYKAWVDFKQIRSSNIQKSIQGYEFFINFKGFPKQVTQITIDISNLKWGTGDKPLTSTATKIQNFSLNRRIFFPAPYQFFFTPHDQEQIRVVVNDNIIGACNWSSDDTCDYKFVDQAPEITNASINTALSQIEITGTNFPTNQLDYQTPIFSGYATTISSITSTSIKLSYTRLIAGPNIVPNIVLKSQGKIKSTLASNHDLNNQNISIVSITPVSIHWKGGQKITVLMNNNLLPFEAKDSQVLVNVDGVACESARYVSNNQIQCISPITTNLGTRVLQVWINSISRTINITINANAIALITSISPASFDISQSRTIQVIIDYATRMDPLRLSARLRRRTLSTTLQNWISLRVQSCQLNAVTNQNTVTLQYIPPSSLEDIDAQYYLVIDDSSNSIRATSSANFVTLNEIQITSINPSQGSQNGGNQITITGTNFPTSKQQMQAKFGDKACKHLRDPTSTEIRCIIQANPTSTSIQQRLQLTVNNIFKKSCNTCLYEWRRDVTPQVNAVTLAVSTLTIDGTNFGTNTANIQVLLNNFQPQTVTTLTNVQIVAQIDRNPQINSNLSLKVLRTDIGLATIPQNLKTFSYTQINSVFTNLSGRGGVTVLSSGGQPLTITGSNFPINVNEGKLSSSNLAFQICSSLKFQSTTQLSCISNPGMQSLTSLKVFIGNVEIAQCTACTYTTTQIKVTSLSIGASSRNLIINFTGFNPAQKTFQRVQTESGRLTTTAITVNTNQVQVQFNQGVGFGSIRLKQLKFSDGSLAQIDTAAVVTNNLSPLPLISQNCSFAGGCQLTIPVNEINLAPQQTKVYVCGVVCERIANAVNINQYNCRAPPILSKGIAQANPHLLKSQNQKNWREFSFYGVNNLFSLFNASSQLAFDQNYATASPAATGNSPCYIGLQINSPLHVATLSRIQYLIPRNANPQDYLQGSFQYSEDLVSWTLINGSLIQNLPNIGWNIIEVSVPNLIRGVRYKSSSNDTDRCIFKEIELIGQIIYIHQSPSVINCSIDVVVNSVVAPPQAGSNVRYQKTSTLQIQSISLAELDANTSSTIRFNSNKSLASVTDIFIEGIRCSSLTALANYVECLSGTKNIQTVLSKKKIQLLTPSGYVVIPSNLTQTGLYYHKWSNSQTWSKVPHDGSNIEIPKHIRVLLDVVKTPKLNKLIIKGELIIKPDVLPSHVREIIANAIIIDGGRLSIGTVASPYTSKLNILLHSERLAQIQEQD